MSKSQDFSKQKVSDEEKQKIMREIETKTEKIIITGIKTGKIVDPIETITQGIPKSEVKQSMDLLQGIMGIGAAEFEQKVGRPVTYSEMRAMFG